MVVTVLIFWGLIHQSQLQFELFSSLLIKPWHVLAIFGLFYLSALVNTWRWYRLNSAQSINLSFLQSIFPTYIGIAFNNVLPGSVGGDFIRCFYVVKKFPEQKSGAILSVMLDRICGLMGIIIIACIVSLLSLETFRQNQSLYYTYIACSGICIAGLIAFCLSVIMPENLGVIDWLKKHGKLHALISVFEAIHVYRKSKMIVIECLMVSVVNQLILLAIILVINQMMGLTAISPSDYIIALAVGQIANLIPLTPGGVGIGEAAFANIILLLNPGVTGAYATVFFAYRLLMTVAYLPGVVGGIFGLKLLRQEKLPV